MGYLRKQNFDEEIVGSLPSEWYKASQHQTKVSNTRARSSPNSVALFGSADSVDSPNQSGFNVPDGAWDMEALRFAVWLGSSADSIYQQLMVTTRPFYGVKISNTYWKYLISFSFLNRHIYIGTNYARYDTGIEFPVETWFEIKIKPVTLTQAEYSFNGTVIGTFNDYKVQNPPYDQKKSVLVTSPSFSEYLAAYYDDFQIGEEEKPLIIKNIKIANAKVVIE